MKLKDFRPNNRHRKQRDSYIERGVTVKRGSKLDKAIRQYKKKGYFSTSLGGNSYEQYRPDPPTLRPSIFGSTSRTNHYRHPLDEEGQQGRFTTTN